MASAESPFVRTSPDASDAYALLRLPRVLQITGLKKTTLYGLIRRNGFPRPIQLSDRLVAWRSADIAVWSKARETKQTRHMHP